MIIIHHGNGVQTALGDILEDKTLIHPPFKDLKVEAVKTLVELFTQNHPQHNPCLVAGPLDDAEPSTLDILLKRIEEPVQYAPELVLWANDYGSVPLTIRSRCGEKYHYAPQIEHEKILTARSLYKALKDKNELEVFSLLKRVEKGSERAVLEAYLEVLVEESDCGKYDETLKRVMNVKRLNKTLLVGYFNGVLK